VIVYSAGKKSRNYLVKVQGSLLPNNICRLEISIKTCEGSRKKFQERKYEYEYEYVKIRIRTYIPRSGKELLPFNLCGYLVRR
jgi:hypothetical protein